MLEKGTLQTTFVWVIQNLVVCQGWKLECVIVAGVARLGFYTAELNSGESSYPKIKC